MAHQVDVPIVVATLGTALTREHARLLKRYTSHVTVLFDADPAGVKASDRSLDIFVEEALRGAKEAFNRKFRALRSAKRQIAVRVAQVAPPLFLFLPQRPLFFSQCPLEK
jgi:MoaA/NifB/PqqE/SkfB family radical SAM enzyme